MKRKRDGQAVILLLLALGIFLLGAVGLAIESSLYYTQRQLAQDAADAAAQAAISSVYGGTNTGPNTFGGSDYTCTGTDQTTPCHFARQHGFGLPGSSDVVDVDFPTSIPGVSGLYTEITPSAVGVTISRPVTTGLLQFVGAQGATIRARGVAAMMEDVGPVPILVLHPNDPAAFAINGNPTVVICGGPERSIQINSRNVLSFDVAGGGGGSSVIDLSKAGPSGPLSSPTDCIGPGAEFGNHGGPFDFTQADNGAPTNVLPVGNYNQTEPVPDPLAGLFDGIEIVPDITVPPDAVPPFTTTPGLGTGGGPCQRAVGRECNVYNPGHHDGGIYIGTGPKGHATNGGEMALFKPGVYYITDGGFEIGSNGIAHMAPCDPSNPADPNRNILTGCGMTVYLRPSDATDIIRFDSNAGQIQGNAFSQQLITELGPVNCTGNCLLGPPLEDPLWNVLFMVDRTINTFFYQEHVFQGGGGLTLAGTIYLTNAQSRFKRPELENNPASYQKLTLQGTPGSITRVVGQIIVDSLQLGGNATINMTLNPDQVAPTVKMALIR